MSFLTPERTVYEGVVGCVEAPGTEGRFGVLTNHAALVTALASGALKVRDAEGKTQRWQASGGFFEVSKNRATVLADSVSG